MIKIETVSQCPHTANPVGVMHISHEVLGIFAGAVHDENEWLALLVGTRSADGLTVTITGLEIPEQDRSCAACSLVHNEPLDSNIVGVIHSHHSMGAFFSQTDDSTLNTRFPTSIVIAQLRHSASEAEGLLGFQYKAEGRAPLPCGSIGVVGFNILPSPMVADWPEERTAGFASPNIETTLHFCPHKSISQAGLYEHCKTKCGIEKDTRIEALFGNDSTEFMKEVNKATRRQYHHNIPVHYTGPQSWGETYHEFLKSRRKEGGYNDDFLRHWGCGE